MKAIVTKKDRYSRGSSPTTIRVFFDYPEDFLESDRMLKAEGWSMELIEGKPFAAARRRDLKKIRTFMPEICEHLGIPVDTKSWWSRKAGCGCGCSPGWVLDHRTFFNGVWAKIR